MSTEYIKAIKDVDTYLTDVEACDLKTELRYELMKVSVLRELKRMRFIRGLYMSCISFSLIFLSQVVRSLGADFF